MEASLRQLFDYDLWANERWILPAETLGHTDVLKHVLSAQSIWLSRCFSGARERPDHLREGFQSLNADWQLLLEQTPLETEIAYKTSQGQPFTNTLGEIALQVLSHGCYHRGELRGLAKAANFEDFPETDFILYCREIGIL